MSKLLLLGNSVNRLGAGPSWPDVVQALAGLAHLQHPVAVNGKPLPIVYEHIVCRNGCDENAIKRSLAQSMRSLAPNWAHQRALELASSNLLTTNYDYCFEASSGRGRRRAHLYRESTYSAFRRARVGTRFVWHIHGELDAPRTLLLGFHQYAGYVQKLRAYLTANRKTSPFHRGEQDFESRGVRFSWVDLFLRDDVHIAGLTLDYVELHLWWLIAYKLRIMSKSASCGSTHFYHLREGEERADVLARLSLLEDLGVGVTRIDVKGDWERAHRDVFDRIEAA